MRKYSIRLFDCRGPLGAIIVDSANGGDGNCSTLIVAQLTQPTNTHVQSETAETITNKRVPALTPTPKGERENQRSDTTTALSQHFHFTIKRHVLFRRRILGHHYVGSPTDGPSPGRYHSLRVREEERERESERKRKRGSVSGGRAPAYAVLYCCCYCRTLLTFIVMMAHIRRGQHSTGSSMRTRR